MKDSLSYLWLALAYNFGVINDKSPNNQVILRYNHCHRHFIEEGAGNEPVMLMLSQNSI